MTENSSLNESIEDIEKLKEAAAKAAENSEDVKNNKCTSEDEKKEPGYVIYQKIADTTINILQNPEVVNAFKEISENVSDELSKNLVTLIAVAMTQSAYQAVLFYDEMLKQELDKQLNHFAEAINADRADINGIKSAMQVFRKKLGDMQNSIK